MRSNAQSNMHVMWAVVILDFLVLNTILYVFRNWESHMIKWSEDKFHVFLLLNNLAMVLAQYKYGTVIHRLMVDGADVFKRVFQLSVAQVFLSYIILKLIDYHLPVGRVYAILGPIIFLTLLLFRNAEWSVVKWFRARGKNTRYVTFIGSDAELENIYHSLNKEASIGYNILGYYADDEIKWNGKETSLEQLGSLDYFMSHMDCKEELKLGDEIYVSLSRLKKDVISKISRFCDQNMIRFYFVPVSVESIGLNMKREWIDDVEIYTTYESPLSNTFNRVVKRLFDIVFSCVILVFLMPFIPLIAYLIKRQSSGPVFYKQKRTGYEGKMFNCYKFRSLHANHQADNTQVSREDPRVFPFGHFMRRMSIDELPQFWNVLKGDMSIVGPRPHMLFHTEKYGEIVDRYMVRHFVKPGISGWAQVTGYRGETKEQWQMEERVKRDIWYTEHWTFWLDVKIIWMTITKVLSKDENAY